MMEAALNALLGQFLRLARILGSLEWAMTYDSLTASPCRLALDPKHGDHGRSLTSFAEVCRLPELCTSCVLINILAARLLSGQKRTGHPFRLLRIEYQQPGREGEVVNLTF